MGAPIAVGPLQGLGAATGHRLGPWPECPSEGLRSARGLAGLDRVRAVSGTHRDLGHQPRVERCLGVASAVERSCSWAGGEGLAAAAAWAWGVGVHGNHLRAPPGGLSPRGGSPPFLRVQWRWWTGSQSWASRASPRSLRGGDQSCLKMVRGAQRRAPGLNGESLGTPCPWPGDGLPGRRDQRGELVPPVWACQSRAAVQTHSIPGRGSAQSRKD